MHSPEHRCPMVSPIFGGNAIEGCTKSLVPAIGMAKASPDCVGEAHGGFASDGSDISGFSHMVRLRQSTVAQSENRPNKSHS